MPSDDKYINCSHGNKMRKEMMMRGIDSSRIILETKGINTHEQAVNIKRLLHTDNPAIILITSPEHMYRAARAFNKVGFSNVGGNSTFGNDIDPELLSKNKSHSDKEINLNLFIRYNFWTQLKYEVILLREFFAICYYKMNGWI